MRYWHIVPATYKPQEYIKIYVSTGGCHLIELGFLKKYDSIKKLMDFGANGYFPLFENDIKTEAFNLIKMTKSDRLKAKSLLKKISGHNSIEKQKVIFSTFNDIERIIVARAFMEMIEGKLLDANPQIQ